MYFSTKENPADVATRGTLVQKLRNDHLWWHGPSWLKQDENTWEKIHDDDAANQKVNDQFKSELRTSENQKESVFVSENGQEITSNKMPYNIDIRRFSSYHKLIRVTAWIERFISKSRRISSNSEKYLSVNETREAEKKWIQSVQRKSFADVFNSTHTGQKNNLKVQLGVFLDNDNLLRCRGRFENADISECAKFPILLPRGRRSPDFLLKKLTKNYFIVVFLIHCVGSGTSFGFHKEELLLGKYYGIVKHARDLKVVLSKCQIWLIFQDQESPEACLFKELVLITLVQFM
ncbi:unnamed protein product [Mytilus coruscus]|uniref:Uncharacterized protein n=1 Tax=Mytilus coruscus TaxID=42192 RepID=A0A6J8B6N2_MYTCO|nr:unnamed protein product [Mytilus coruscus]